MRAYSYILSLLGLLLLGNPLISQIPQFSEPVELDVNINSEGEESAPILHPGGKQLFFTRTLYKNNIGGIAAGQDIWVSHVKENGSWTKANNNLPEWNNRLNNSVLGFNKDGNTVFLLNAYQVKGQPTGIAFSRFFNGSWTKPEPIKIKGLEVQGFIGFYISPNYDVIIISMNDRNSIGEEDLYISFNEGGKWTKPKNMGPTINSSGFEISPFLDQDQRTLYFASNGRVGFGDSDIYMSKRLYDSWDVWSTPVNLGPAVNSDKFDAYFSLVDSVGYFVSNRNGDFTNIYKTIKSDNVRDVSQAKIDSILLEAQNLLIDLQKTNAGKSEELSKFITFEFNSSDLDSKRQNQLNKILDQIDPQQIAMFKLIGFSNDFDSESMNEDLSFKRMEAIKNHFISANISEDKIQSVVTNETSAVSKNKSGVEVQVFIQGTDN